MNVTQQQLTYREASIADKDQLKANNIAAYSPYAQILAPQHWETMKNGLYSDEKLEQLIGQSTVFVCCDGDSIVGAAYLIPHGNPYHCFEAEWSYIRMVGVRPGYEGRGICRTLIASCIDRAKQRGEQTIALHTSEFMDAARHIYEKQGFTVLREIDPIFGKRYWLYTLSLT